VSKSRQAAVRQAGRRGKVVSIERAAAELRPKVLCEGGPLCGRTGYPQEILKHPHNGKPCFLFPVDGIPFRYCETAGGEDGVRTFRWDPWTDQEGAGSGIHKKAYKAAAAKRVPLEYPA
jgi:hypothetical protein